MRHALTPIYNLIELDLSYGRQQSFYHFEKMKNEIEEKNWLKSRRQARKRTAKKKCRSIIIDREKMKEARNKRWKWKQDKLHDHNISISDCENSSSF